MALPTVKFNYDRKKRGSTSKAASIDVEVIYNRKHRYFSTGVKVLPNQWNGSQIVNHPEGIAANALLQQKLRELRTEATDYSISKQGMARKYGTQGTIAWRNLLKMLPVIGLTLGREQRLETLKPICFKFQMNTTTRCLFSCQGMVYIGM